MSRRRTRGTIGIALWTAILGLDLAAALPADAQAPAPKGSELQVNTYTTSEQRYPAVAAAADGGFVVVWTSDGSSGTDTDYQSIQGQRYASSGSTQGSQFQVNTFTTDSQYDSSVAMASDGAFVVVWTSYASSGTDTDGTSILAQRYVADGSPLGPEFQVNTYTTGSAEDPSVAMAANGDFVVVWASYGSFAADSDAKSVQGQRYGSNGSPQGTQFQVNTFTAYNQDTPSVAAAPGGAFVVVWKGDLSSGTDSSTTSVHGQRYASNGSAQGVEFQVNTYTTSYQSYPSVAVAPDTSFVVTWESAGSSGTDTSFRSIQGQRYAASGAALGAQFQVNTYTTGSQFYPFVAADDLGFIVAWESAGSFGTDTSDNSIQARRFGSDGSSQGSEFQVNTYTPREQNYPAVAAASGGRFVVVWDSEKSSGSDPNSESIHAQLYRVAFAVAAMAPATRLSLCAALLVSAGLALRVRASPRAPSPRAGRS